MVIVSLSAGSVQRCEPSDTAISVSTNTPPGSQPVCAILPARPAPGPERLASMSRVTRVHTTQNIVLRPRERPPPTRAAYEPPCAKETESGGILRSVTRDRRTDVLPLRA
jgi:hypothetical protein